MLDRVYKISLKKRRVCDICGKTSTRNAVYKENNKAVCFSCIQGMRQATRNAFLEGRLGNG